MRMAHRFESNVDDHRAVVGEIESEIRALWSTMHDARRRIVASKVAYNPPQREGIGFNDANLSQCTVCHSIFSCSCPKPWDFDVRWERRCRDMLMMFLDCRRAGIMRRDIPWQLSSYRPVKTRAGMV